MYRLLTRTELEEYFLEPCDLETFMKYKKDPLQFFVDSDEDDTVEIKSQIKQSDDTVIDRDSDSQSSTDTEEIAT